MRNPHFFQKYCHFRWNQNQVSENYNTFERNEDCATVFLKWTDFNEMKDLKKYEYVNCKNSWIWKCCSKSNNIKLQRLTCLRWLLWQSLLFLFVLFWFFFFFSLIIFSAALHQYNTILIQLDRLGLETIKKGKMNN